MKGEDRRLVRLTALCSEFPEITRELSGSHATFRVRGKPFGYFLDDHHGDGVVSFCLRLDRGRPDWKAVAGFARDSYRLVAPRTLIARLGRQP